MREKLLALGLFVSVVGTIVIVVVSHKAPGWKSAFCEKIPEFSDFTVNKIFDGSRPIISGSDFDLNDWKNELISATVSAVNYAGEYVVKAKPCQKNNSCIQHLIINVHTGFVVNMGLYSKQEAQYRADSSLFEVETTSTTSAQKTYYQIKNDKMELVCIENKK